MKKFNLFLMTILFSLMLFSSCETENMLVEEAVVSSQIEEGKTIEDYPAEITLENWKEFVYAPQEVLDFHAQKGFTKKELETINRKSIKDKILPGNLSGIFEAFNEESWKGISEVDLTISNDPNCSTVTNSLGNYLIVDDCGSTLCSSYETPNNNGVSTLDLIYIERHILNISPFTDARQVIAADVNRNGIVSTLDLFLIRRILLLDDNGWGNSENLIFLPLNVYNEAQALMPNIPPDLLVTYGTFNPCSAYADDSDRRVIKTGDVNGSFNF